MQQGKVLLTIAIVLAAGYGYGAEPDQMPRRSPTVPERPEDAAEGSEVIRKIKHLQDSRRERRIFQEIIKGNIPRFLRKLYPVVMQKMVGGRVFTATLQVMPDYLAVGSDRDYFRVPLTLETAQRVALHFGYVLPTPTMVDAIYKQASHRLSPRPLPPGPRMTGLSYLRMHEAFVHEQLRSIVSSRGLLAGHKKDVVLSERLFHRPQALAIYGWHRIE